MSKKSTRKAKPAYRTPPPQKNGLATTATATPIGNPLEGISLQENSVVYSAEPAPQNTLIHADDKNGLWLYNGNSLSLLDRIAKKYPEGCFDCIFADPPYFLSNGGITCHAGRMVKVDKGAWDKSQGIKENHNFNKQWLRRCRKVLKQNGTIWVSGTHHVIFSVGFAMQELGFKILNDIAWEKPNPPPNLSCRYFTHSVETLLWAAKNEKSKHTFNYAAMKAVTGKQMKTVWREDEFPVTDEEMPPIWTFLPPGKDEKTFGKHPTQKPVALIERCILASTNEGDLILDPFMGSGTTAIASLTRKRRFVGIELDQTYAKSAVQRVKAHLKNPELFARSELPL